MKVFKLVLKYGLDVLFLIGIIYIIFSRTYLDTRIMVVDCQNDDCEVVMIEEYSKRMDESWDVIGEKVNIKVLQDLNYSKDG